jgi:hypothetical protein
MIVTKTGGGSGATVVRPPSFCAARTFLAHGLSPDAFGFQT